MGKADVFIFKEQTLSDFESYYYAVQNYISSLIEIKTKNSSSNEKSKVFPVGLYGISENDINMLFNAYMSS